MCNLMGMYDELETLIPNVGWECMKLDFFHRNDELRSECKQFHQIHTKTTNRRVLEFLLR